MEPVRIALYFPDGGGMSVTGAAGSNFVYLYIIADIFSSLDIKVGDTLIALWSLWVILCWMARDSWFMVGLLYINRGGQNA